MAVQNIVSQIRGAFSKSSTTPSYGTVERAPLPRKHSGTSSDTSSTLSVQSDLEDNEDDADSSKSSRKPFISPRLISDATIGLSDGLTVPFALTAGLSALGDTRLVIYGGMAELFAGAISMGVGGYLGARSEWYVNLEFYSGSTANSSQSSIQCCSHRHQAHSQRQTRRSKVAGPLCHV